MSDQIDQIRKLLHEAAETHHLVYRITDGVDDDWATWYADWLTQHSELGDLLGRSLVRSHVTHHLVALDQEYERTAPDKPWEQFYAERLVREVG
jgi:hypothetical protein